MSRTWGLTRSCRSNKLQKAFVLQGEFFSLLPLDPCFQTDFLHIQVISSSFGTHSWSEIFFKICAFLLGNKWWEMFCKRQLRSDADGGHLKKPQLQLGHVPWVPWENPHCYCIPEIQVLLPQWFFCRWFMGSCWQPDVTEVTFTLGLGCRAQRGQ